MGISSVLTAFSEAALREGGEREASRGGARGARDRHHRRIAGVGRIQEEGARSSYNNHCGSVSCSGLRTPACSVRTLTLVCEQNTDIHCRRKIHEIKNSKTKLTPTSTNVLKERRDAVLSKLAVFRRHQARFMPGVNELLEEEQDERRVKRLPEPDPEDVKLFMPASCPRDLVVPESLRRKEAALRRGQCTDCISIIRGRLIAQRHLVSFRNANAAGQWRTTRTAHLMATISEKLNDAVARYTIFQAALQALEGETGCLPFRVLDPKDVELYSSAEVDVASVRKLGRASSGRNSRVTSAGGGKDTMHWLWTADGGPTGDDGDALREGKSRLNMNWVS